MASRMGVFQYVVRLSNGTYATNKRTVFTKNRAQAERFTLDEARHVRKRIREKIDGAAEVFNAD